MFSLNLHVSIFTLALAIWNEHYGSSGTFVGKRWVHCMAHHVKHDTFITEGILRNL